MFKSLLPGVVALCLVATASAQTTTSDASLPAALKDWRAWVLKDLDYRACPFIATQAPNSREAFVCAWPGRLSLNAGDTGLDFSVRWRIEAPGWLPLPGDAEHWPQQVTVNGQRQPVIPHDGAPSLWLESGSAEIAGRIGWSERPQSIHLPSRIGLISLTLDGKAIAPLQRNGDDLMLGRGAATAPQADSIDLRVYRKLSDGVPAELTTRIVLSVSGQAREEVLGPALPAGFEPLALTGTWPARIGDDGRLHVQVQPGADTLELSARATEPLTTLTAHLPPPPWAKQEIWSYEAAPRLRVTSASSAVQVDPRQLEVPEDWTALPAFALGDGAKIDIEQRSRGLAPDEGNRLSLQREAWLDFAGDGWFARDHVRGQMLQGWRFDVAKPFALERASDEGAQRRGAGGETLLVTAGASPGLSGVEWRTPAVNLGAGVRIAPVLDLPVAGWQQTFDRVDATLHFPFGYKLLAAPGADGAVGSWMAGWTLLDAFICAILVLLAWRLLGLVGAAATVAYLLLGYQESGSPLWGLVVVFALALIARALPDGKLERAADLLRRVALGVLVLTALPFVAEQLRFALYPQLEQGAGAGVATNVSESAAPPQNAPVVQEEAVPMSTPAPPPALPAPPQRELSMQRAAGKGAQLNADMAKSAGGLDRIVVTGSNIQRADQIDHYSQSTVVQTGTGEPSWQLGSSAQLSWSGPVLMTQSVHLIIAPPWLVRPLRVALVALLAWLLWRLFGAAAPLRRVGTPVATAAILLLATLSAMPNAQAQTYPSDELLQQLRQRLTEPPKCAPARAAASLKWQVAGNGDTISVAIEAHAAERIALPLPTTDEATTLKSIKVDGAVDDNLARGGNGALWLALGRGVHRVEVEYAASRRRQGRAGVCR